MRLMLSCVSSGDCFTIAVYEMSFTLSLGIALGALVIVLVVVAVIFARHHRSRTRAPPVETDILPAFDRSSYVADFANPTCLFQSEKTTDRPNERKYIKGLSKTASFISEVPSWRGNKRCASDLSIYICNMVFSSKHSRNSWLEIMIDSTTSPIYISCYRSHR